MRVYPKEFIEWYNKNNAIFFERKLDPSEIAYEAWKESERLREVGSSVSTEETIIDFAMWYSGMERGKVESAFERYKREVLRSRLTAKEKGK